jgi:hypothetical protein
MDDVNYISRLSFPSDDKSDVESDDVQEADKQPICPKSTTFKNIAVVKLPTKVPS